jgi:hypothetical protein
MPRSFKECCERHSRGVITLGERLPSVRVNRDESSRSQISSRLAAAERPIFGCTVPKRT